MANATTPTELELWRTVVGPSVKIPTETSYVYYFPQGHLENSAIDNYDGIPRNPKIPCRVSSLSFLSSDSSDECFVKIRLQPLNPEEVLQSTTQHATENNVDQTGMASFLKVISTSDATLPVPTRCAEAIFPLFKGPRLYRVQNITMRDTRNITWKFTHSRQMGQHYLRAGWTEFINDKGLIPGDSVLFIKRMQTGEMFIGIRRETRFDDVDSNIVEVAITNAALGKEFDVVYYPRPGLSDFVVSAGRVDASLDINWAAGMEVRMSVPTGDPLIPTTWIEGEIAAVNSQVNDQWPQSPWRMLKVSWNERPGKSRYTSDVNPWEVELKPPVFSHPNSAFSPYKELKSGGDQGRCLSKKVPFKLFEKSIDQIEEGSSSQK